MNTGYSENDYVRYASSGICKIESIKTMKSPDNKKPTEYYILKPVSNPTATLYVPTENAVLASRMSPVLGRAELDEMILSSDKAEIFWDEDRKLRGESFGEILRKCDKRELLSLVQCIYSKKKELSAIGKKLSPTDENALKQAEKFICSDFSFVLGISESEVGAYIRSLIGITETE